MTILASEDVRLKELYDKRTEGDGGKIVEACLRICVCVYVYIYIIHIK